MAYNTVWCRTMLLKLWKDVELLPGRRTWALKALDPLGDHLFCTPIAKRQMIMCFFVTSFGIVLSPTQLVPCWGKSILPFTL